MKITEDLHVHTRFSTDSVADMRESVICAIEKGLTAIAFTEHCDLDYPVMFREYIIEELGEEGRKLHPELSSGKIFEADFDAYFDELTGVRAEFGDRIRILSGIEMGMRADRPDLLAEFRKIVNSHDFDVILGSVHLIDGVDPYYPFVWEDIDPDEFLSHYFSQMLVCVKEYDFFTSLAHIDYPVRYVPAEKMGMSAGDYFENVYIRHRKTIDEILKILIERGQALEINTRGLFCDFRHVHPSENILNRYRELGGTRFTYGSDAHFAKKAGAGFDGI